MLELEYAEVSIVSVNEFFEMDSCKKKARNSMGFQKRVL